MIRVLVMAESVQLTDAIVTNLAQETNLKLLRLTQPAPISSLQEIRQECSVLIIVEEEESKSTFITANDLLRDSGCFRLIMLPAHMYQCRPNDRYEMPLSGTAQVIDLATDVR